MPWNPETLFETSLRPLDPSLRIYRSDEAALDAVAAGRKPIWYVPAIRSELGEWQGLASARGLACTVIDEPSVARAREPQPVSVFVARPEELWRVPALQTLWKAAASTGAWSDAAEEQMGDLLGYTPKQRARWIAMQRHASPAWGSKTLYAVVDRRALQRIEAVGRRCLGKISEIVDLPVLVHPYLPRADARTRLPRDHTLVRAGLHRDAVRVFGRLSGGLTTHVLTARTAAIVSANLTSNVQLLTGTGWR